MRNFKVRRGTMVVIAAAFLLVALLLMSQSAWATSAQDQLRQTVPPPTPVPGDCTVVLPPQQDGNDDYEFICEPVPDVPCSPPAGCSLGSTVSIEAYLGTQLVYPTSFDPPLEICLRYSQELIDANGGVVNLAVAYWDEATSSWVQLDNSRYDANLGLVCGDISFLPNTACGFGVTCAISPGGVPVTGEETGSSTITVWLLLAAGLILAAGTVLWRRVET